MSVECLVLFLTVHSLEVNLGVSEARKVQALKEYKSKWLEGIDVNLGNEPESNCKVSPFFQDVTKLDLNPRSESKYVSECKAGRFSTLDDDGMLDVVCETPDVKYARVPIGEAQPPGPTDASWHDYEGTTNIGADFEKLFVMCTLRNQKIVYNVHFGRTYAPDKTKLQEAKQLYAEMEYKEKPPNVYILMFQAMSRQDFHRSFPQTIARLRQYIGSRDVLVNEFLRYSSVAWGSGVNQAAIMRGCRFPCSRESATLEQLYRDAGYVTMGSPKGYGVPQMEQPKSNAKNATKPRSENVYVESYGLLGADALGGPGCKFAKTSLERVSATFRQMEKAYKDADPDLPRFYAQHIADEDSKIPGYSKGLDEELLKILDAIDMSSSVVLFVSDHGKFFRDDKDSWQYMIESKNPVAILTTPNEGFLSREDVVVLNANQHRLVSHWDMHYHLRRLFRGLSKNPPPDTWSNDIESAVYPNTPFYPPNMGIQPFLLSAEFIPATRSCEDAGAPDLNFCFCAVPQPVEVTEKMRDKLRPIMQYAVKRVNDKMKEKECPNFALDIRLTGIDIAYIGEGSSCKGPAGTINIEDMIEVPHRGTHPGPWVFYGVDTKRRGSNVRLLLDACGDLVDFNGKMSVARLRDTNYGFGSCAGVNTTCPFEGSCVTYHEDE